MVLNADSKAEMLYEKLVREAPESGLLPPSPD